LKKWLCLVGEKLSFCRSPLKKLIVFIKSLANGRRVRQKEGALARLPKPGSVARAIAAVEKRAELVNEGYNLAHEIGDMLAICLDRVRRVVEQPDRVSGFVERPIAFGMQFVTVDPKVPDKPIGSISAETSSDRLQQQDNPQKIQDIMSNTMRKKEKSASVQRRFVTFDTI
jgi:hypothetical protein